MGIMKPVKKIVIKLILTMPPDAFKLIAVAWLGWQKPS